MATPHPSLRVLLVEDDGDDAFFVRRLLEKADPGLTLVHVTGIAEALNRAGDEAFDAALLDLGLPDSAGLAGLHRLRDAAPDVAVVILSGDADRALAVEAVRGGAQDYVVKGRGDGEVLLRALRYAVERRRTLAQLHAATDELREVYERAPCGYHTTDPNGVILQMNRTELEWLGYMADEVVGRLKIEDLLTPVSARLLKDVGHRLRQQSFFSGLEVDMVRKDRSTFPALLAATAISDARGMFVRNRFTVMDLTERRRAQDDRDHLLEQLEQAQRRAQWFSALLPVCTSCKRIQDDEGVWIDLESFVRSRPEGDTAQLLCPDCLRRFNPELRDDD